MTARRSHPRTLTGSSGARVLLAVALLAVAAGCAGGGRAGRPAREARPAPAPGAPSPAPGPPAGPGPAEAGAETELRPLPGALWVIVENGPGSRPQAGLDRADVVYELEAEGGITRFLAAFTRGPVPRIGPVRSVRYYFLQIVKPYGGPIAHAGGNADALAMLARDRSYQDMDEIYGSGAYFWRNPDRKMPHNLYTSTDLLLKGARARRYTLRPLPDWPRGEMPGGEAVSRVQLRYPLDFTRVEFRWEGGRWQRWQDGEPHRVEGGAQLAADNLVVLFPTRYGIYRTGGEEARRIGIIGEGDGRLFARGRSWAIRWHKPRPEEPFAFTAGDRAARLVPGTVWIAVVPGPESLSAS